MVIEKQETQLKEQSLKQLPVALTALCNNHKRENAQNKS